MLWFDLLLFLACIALLIYTFKRDMQEGARKRRALALIVRGALVALMLVFGAASAITYGQTRLIMQQRTYLYAMLASWSEVQQAVETSSQHPEPCNRANGQAERFFATYVTGPTVHGVPVYNHSVGAVLAVAAYEALQQRGCVTAQAAAAVVARARAEQDVDARTPPFGVRLLARVPIGVFSNMSLAKDEGYVWSRISPNAMAVQDCFDRLLRKGITPTDTHEKTCRAATAGA